MQVEYKKNHCEVCAIPPIEQKRSMDGAQFHSPWVGNAGGGLIQSEKQKQEQPQVPVRLRSGQAFDSAGRAERGPLRSG